MRAESNNNNDLPSPLAGEGVAEQATDEGEPQFLFTTFSCFSEWQVATYHRLMIKRMISISRKLRRDITVAETALWRELRDRRLKGYKFRRQFPIEGFVVDFGCLEARVTIELDGPVHEGREQDDAHRSRIIRAQGFLEKRYRNEDVFERLHWVVEDIKATVEKRLQVSPHPSSFG